MTGTAVVCTQTLLRLGIVSTILVGTALAAGGLFARMASLQGQAADWKL